MLNFLKKRIKNKNVNSKAFKQDMADHLDGRHIKYVTERKNDNDYVIGREGAIIKKDDELIVYASSDILFRSKILDITASELLSLEGVIITGPDMEHNGEERTVIAYYTYYLKTPERN